MIIWLNKLIFIKTNLYIKDLINIDPRPFKNIVLFELDYYLGGMGAVLEYLPQDRYYVVTIRPMVLEKF